MQGPFEYEPRHRVEVGGGGLASEAHRLQGDRATPGKWIQNLGSPAPKGVSNRLSESGKVRLPLLQDALVFFLFLLAPRLRLSPYPTEDAAFNLLLDPLGGTPVRHALALHRLHDSPPDSIAQRSALLRRAGVGKQRGEDRGTRGRQGTAGGPDVERGDMSVPDVLFMNRGEGCLFERKGVLNQATIIHPGFSLLAKLLLRHVSGGGQSGPSQWPWR